MRGTMLGNRYEVLEKIGEGGMAEVYKAKCHLLNRYVAIKILKKEFNDNAEFVEKFKTEAKAAASLSDVHIVNMYDVGSDKDINYIVMEYVKGKTLKELIKEKGNLTSNEAIDISLQIAKALECAHKNGIIHRDIKPHNILISENGIVKVTDFGIAKMSNYSTITNTNKIVGSAHYFSPEQAKGSLVDYRSDLYSLGIVMYEMVTGKLPFDAESPVSIALKHINEKPMAPMEINREISQSLNNVILKCIEKEPIRRYENSNEIISDLEKIKNGDLLNFYNKNDETRIMSPVDIENTNILDNQDELDDDFEEEIEDEEDIRQNKNKKKNKKIPIMLSVIVFILIIGAVSIFLLKTNAKTTVVPNVIGLNKEKAKKEIEKSKLNFVVIGVEESDKPENTVIECYPREGAKVKIKSEVRVKVSAGQGKKVLIPNVIDMDLESAKNMLINEKLDIGDISYRRDESKQDNIILSQSPKGNKKVKAGTKIDLVVNKNEDKNKIKVPNLKNKKIEEAESILKSVGLNLGNKIEIKTSDKEKEGVIFNQSKAPDASVEKGTNIDVTYFKYDKHMDSQP